MNINEKEEIFLQIIEDIRDLLSKADTFKIKDCLYKIECEELNTIISSLYELKIPKRYPSYKDILKEQIVLQLKLKQNDTIFFFHEIIYVKIFLHVESKNSQEKRACGIEPEILKKYADEYFPNNSYKESVFELLDCAIEDTIGFRRVNPMKFSKMFISVFINIFEIVIMECTDIKDRVLIRGFSLYLLRESFDEMMLYISEDILFNFSNADKKAVEFLSYLSVNEKIDSKGVRYKPRPILDDSNHAWNITTIRSTMLQHKKAKQALYEKKSKLIEIKKRLDKYNFDISAIEKIKKAEETELNLVDTKIEGIKKTLKKLEDNDAQKVKYIDDGEEKTYERKPLIAKLFKKEDVLLSKKNQFKKKIEQLNQQIQNKEKDIATWQKKYDDDKEFLEKIEKKGHPTDELYRRIKKALAKTLAKRR